MSFNNFKYKLSNTLGMSLIEVLISLAILSILALSYSSSFSALQAMNAKSRMMNGATQVMESVREILASEPSWRTTAESPTNADVLICSGGSLVANCARGKKTSDTNNDGINDNGGIDLFLSGSNVAFYSTKVNAGLWGFTADGIPCQNFNLQNGNDDCPFRVEIDIAISCGNPLCTMRSTTLSGRLLYRPNKLPIFRTAPYSFEVNHPAPIADRVACENNGGVINPQTGQCRFNIAADSCAGGQVMVAIVNGSAVCSDIEDL